VIIPCFNSGPLVREAVASLAVDEPLELVVVDDQFRTMIHDGAGEHELERYARTLTPSIRDDGRAKVLKGETTIEEVLRVTRED
jgi:type II secretory ATPase GspE/PulE/Tfp pilus assembly ATPase PilB-like protein